MAKRTTTLFQVTDEGTVEFGEETRGLLKKETVYQVRLNGEVVFESTDYHLVRDEYDKRVPPVDMSDPNDFLKSIGIF